MNARTRTEVCITIDTEFSVGGNFENPELHPVAEPMVLGEIDGKEHGLGFLLDSLSEFGMCATFFVEALQTAYFGYEPMGGFVGRSRNGALVATNPGVTSRRTICPACCASWGRNAVDHSW